MSSQLTFIRICTIHTTKFNNSEHHTMCYVAIPLQLIPSLARAYPSSQLHMNDDGVFIQCCWQPPLLTAHSSLSVRETASIVINTHDVMQSAHTNTAVSIDRESESIFTGAGEGAISVAADLITVVGSSLTFIHICQGRQCYI